MKKIGIVYRITAALTITAILTAIFSILLFHILTKKAFGDYLKESTVQLGWEIAGFLEQMYVQGGWGAVSAFVAETPIVRGHHKMMMGNNMGHRGTGTVMSIAQRQLILTDAKGHIMSSSRGLRLEEPLPKTLWDAKVPMTIAGDTVGFLMVMPPDVPYEDGLEFVFTRTLSHYSYWSLLVSLLIAVLIGLSISPELVRPIGLLSKKVRRFAQGERNIVFSVESEDELGTLAEDFGIMAEKIKTDEELKKNLTADIAHELRTPLAILGGTLESLQDDVIEPTDDVFASMQDEVLRMTHLVKDLSDLTLVEAGQLKLNLEQISPSVLRGKFSYFKTEAQLKGTIFAVDIPENLPIVSMDIVRITQVISNLLSNALRHTTSGKVSLTCEEVEGGVVFSVEDTGTGINAEELPYIFERFCREDKSRSRKTGGMGLGLSIAKGMVEAHRGRIWAESVEGRGSKFSFFLPN